MLLCLRVFLLLQVKFAERKKSIRGIGSKFNRLLKGEFSFVPLLCIHAGSAQRNLGFRKVWINGNGLLKMLYAFSEFVFFKQRSLALLKFAASFGRHVCIQHFRVRWWRLNTRDLRHELNLNKVT